MEITEPNEGRPEHAVASELRDRLGRSNIKRIKYVVTVDYAGPDDKVVNLMVDCCLQEINESPVSRVVAIERMDEA